MNWIYVALKRVQRRAVVNAVMKTGSTKVRTKRLSRTQERFCSTAAAVYIVVLVQAMCVPSTFEKLEMSLHLFISRHNGHITRTQA
jgi:hypothetical protein